MLKNIIIQIISNLLAIKYIVNNKCDIISNININIYNIKFMGIVGLLVVVTLLN
jgi:hypothetical protein